MDKYKNMVPNLQRIFIILFIIQTLHQSITCTNNCILKETCGSCIAESPKCAWCTQEGFSDNGVPRCDFKSNLEAKCDKTKIVSPVGSFVLVKDMSLSDKGADKSEAIQIKPQEIRIKLRPNSIEKFKVEFRQAVDYPVDLYYLMDLSNSMADDKIKLAGLGNKLAKEMKDITNNFKLGFGSFVDKTVTPFVNAYPEKLKEPCPKCAAPYGFHNNMPLSSKTHEFQIKVQEAPVSGNLDPPEGGFDAVMQAIVCKKEIGWRNESRKLLVYSTDNSFHYAGDGKLGGIVTPNDEKCHLDEKGYYTMSNVLDYPSLSQINRQIREHKINMIFAVTNDQVPLYESLSGRLVGAGTGKLERDSSNVVDLVRDQYNKITSEVEMADDNTDSNIRVSYFSSCLGNKMEQTNMCKGLKVGKNVTFEVHLEYLFCPEDGQSRNRTFNIFPVGLQEQLTVHIEMMCDCDCEKPWNEEAKSPKCSDGNGTFECGICNCNKQRYGKECECDASDMDPYLEAKGCFNNDDTRPCSGVGKCRCGRCYCDARANPKELVYGKYCECNNFSCDKKDGKFCNDHGLCECGACRCFTGWKGDDCSCRDAPQNCIGPTGDVCSGRGVCDCGACKCTDGDYFGKYCDDCTTCPGMCDELRPCIECFLESQKKALNCSMCGPIEVLPIEHIEVGEKEKQCSFEDEKKCRFTFKYAFDNQNQLLVWSKMRKACPEPVDLVSIIAGVSGGVVATGIFFLMLWKILTVIHDRRELAKFEKERLMAKWNQGQNPLYKEVQTTYQNPAYGGTAGSMAQPIESDEMNLYNE